MSDLRDPVRRAADKYEPPPNWRDRINERVRVRRRNRRLAAGIVGLGIPILLLALLLANVTLSSDSQPAVNPPARQCQPGRPEPTAFWRAENTTTDIASGIKAILHGDATFEPGVVGNSFALDGDGDFVEVPDSRAPHLGSNNFTISIWVKFNSTEGSPVLIEDWIETKSLHGPKGWTVVKLKNDVVGFGTNVGGYDSQPLEIQANTWIHIAIRRANGDLSTFVDGQLVAGGAMEYPGRSTDSEASLMIGHRGSPDETPGSRDRRGFFLNGSVDEIAFFIGQGLSDDAIRRIFETRGACLP